MRRIIVALVLVAAFGVGLLAGFSNHSATAATVCSFTACEQDPKGFYAHWVCCRDTQTGQVDCARTTTGCAQFPTRLY